MQAIKKTPEIPLISIIIPAYNRETLIGETLQSIINQKYTNWECIIVDDGSTDNTIHVIKEYSDKDDRISFHLRSASPKGANTCRNIGFENSKGDFIQFFDSDDLMDPFLLDKKVRIYQSNPDVELIICKHKLFPAEHHLSKIPVNIQSTNYINDFVAEKVKLNTPNTLIKKEVIYRSGMFNTSLLRAQEVEFYTRVLLVAKQIKILNEDLIFVRTHENSITSAYLNQSIKYVRSDVESRLLIFKQISGNSLIKKDAIAHLQKVVAFNFYTIIKTKRIGLCLTTFSDLIKSNLYRTKKSNFIKFSLFGALFLLTNRFQQYLYNALKDFH